VHKLLFSPNTDVNSSTSTDLECPQVQTSFGAQVKGAIKIHDIRLFGDPPFAFRSSARVFIRVQIGDGGPSARTQTRSWTRTTNANSTDPSCVFEDEAPLELRYHASGSQLVQMMVSLWEELGPISQRLAFSVLSFPAFDSPRMQSKELPFAEWSSAIRVARVIEQLKEKGEALPRLTISISPLKEQ
jgi:hypothetical protein